MTGFSSPPGSDDRDVRQSIHDQDALASTSTHGLEKISFWKKVFIFTFLFKLGCDESHNKSR
jgi:hypothetical protein